MTATTPGLIVHLRKKKDLGNRRGFRNARSLGDKNTPPLQVVEVEDKVTHLWDQAHQLVESDEDIEFAEPDVESDENSFVNALRKEQETRGDDKENSYYTYIDYWPHPERPFPWHLGDDFSQLQSAREYVKSLQPQQIVRIAHLDTGYTPGHACFPDAIINKKLQRNFAPGEDDNINSAEDPLVTGLGKMPGHGIGTLSILAGNKMKIPAYGFDDYLGLYDKIEIVPIRIASSVILLKSASFVKAMDYIVNELNSNESTRVHIITMSMGGLPSKAWATMVNQAYEQGIFMVSAAGNNFAKMPARTMVFPARFKRVLAACGVTYARTPYRLVANQESLTRMEGNYGPLALMDTAMAAFTPNVTWATYKFPQVVGIRGDGTSSATPQIASAAALYYLKNYDALEKLPDPWMRVEAIRHALFSTADHTINAPYQPGDYKRYFGQGILQASKMLDVPVQEFDINQKQPRDKVFFPLIRLLLGIRRGPGQLHDEMLETELMQLVMDDARLQELLNDEETDITELTKEQQLQFADIVQQNPKASDTLKKRMRDIKERLLGQ